MAKNVKIKDVKKQLHPFLKDLISAADVDSGAVRFSITVFGPDAQVQFGFDKFNKKAKLVKAVNRLKPKFIRTGISKSVSMFDELLKSVFVEAKGDRPQVPNVLILITDVKSTGDQNLIQERANILKSTGTQIFTIGLRAADQTELKGIASEPNDDNSYFGNVYADLQTEQLKNKLGGSISACKCILLFLQCKIIWKQISFKIRV